MMSGQTLRATIDGRTYDIPEVWVMGFCREGTGRTVIDAIEFWHHQALLEEREAR